MPVAGYTSQYDFTTGVWGNGSDMSYHLHECKSIGGSTLDKIGDGVWDKFNQFLDGLGSVPSLNNYHLHFNPAAFAGDPLRAKKALHGLFEKKSEKIFQRLFGNPTLSTNLFQGRTEAQARIFFLEKINPTDGTTIANNTFFNFVQ